MQEADTPARKGWLTSIIESLAADERAAKHTGLADKLSKAIQVNGQHYGTSNGHSNGHATGAALPGREFLVETAPVRTMDELTPDEPCCSKRCGFQFKLPLPFRLSGRKGLRRLSVTLVWFTAVTPGRRAYRSERLIVEEPSDDHLNQILTGGTRHQPDANRTSRGTVFSRSWDSEAIRLQKCQQPYQPELAEGSNNGAM